MCVGGYGLVSCYGTGAQAVVEPLRARRPGSAPLTGLHLPLPETLPVNRMDPQRYPAGMAGTQAAMLAAAHEALTMAGLDRTHALTDCALVLGGTGSLAIAEAEIRRVWERTGVATALPVTSAGAMARQLATTLGLDGPLFCLATACASSANALLVARDLIRRGQARRALVIGAERLSAITLSGFQSLLLLDPAGCRPFDAARRGLQLGEGVGALWLEPVPAGHADSGRRHRFHGGANLCDTHHMTSASPDGGAMARVMQAALTQAGVAAEEIVAIKAHGTGSADNDLAEAAAMKTVFGARVPPFTGLKRGLGHTLAACGAVETVAFLACLDAGFIPPTAGFEAFDPALGVQPLVPAQDAPAGIYLYNFFGFGGNYGTLVIGHG